MRQADCVRRACSRSRVEAKRGGRERRGATRRRRGDPGFQGTVFSVFVSVRAGSLQGQVEARSGHRAVQGFFAVGEHVLFPDGNIIAFSKAYDIKYSRTVT
jgi:hypothetical protein